MSKEQIVPVDDQTKAGQNEAVPQGDIGLELLADDKTSPEDSPIPKPPGHETEAALIEEDKRHKEAGKPSDDLESLDLEEFFRRQFDVDAGRKAPKQEKEKTNAQGEAPKKSTQTAASPEQDQKKEDKQEDEAALQAEAEGESQEPEEDRHEGQTTLNLTPDRIDEIAEKAASKAVQEAQKKQAGTEQGRPSPTSDVQSIIDRLSSAEKRRLQVLQKLEQLYPDKYEGLYNRYLASLKEADEYAANWEKENPGETWRDEDHEEELAEIAKKHKIFWDDDDYDEALVELKAEEKLPKLTEEIEKRLAEKQKQEAERQRITATIIQDTDHTIRQTLNEVKEALQDAGVDLDLYDETGRLQQEKLQKLAEEDPVVYRTVIHTIAGGLAPAVYELLQIWRGVKSYDPKHETHQWLDSFILEKEKQIASLPKEQRLYNGKDFLPLEQYAALSPNERAKYWTLREEDVLLMLRHHFADKAKEAYKNEIQSIEKWMAKKQKGGQPMQGAAHNKAPKASHNKPVSASPSSMSVPRGASRQATAASSQEGVPEEFLRTLLGE